MVVSRGWHLENVVQRKKYMIQKNKFNIMTTVKDNNKIWDF